MRTHVRQVHAAHDKQQQQLDSQHASKNMRYAEKVKAKRLAQCWTPEASMLPQSMGSSALLA